jgi:hypothetical protein
MPVHQVAFALLALLPVSGRPAAPPGTLSGITYTVDTTSGGDIVAGILDPIALRVTYAEGKGRIDVLARATRPAVRVKWITVALNSASPGDYYLFDDAEVVHVRPGSKTFSRYTLADVSHNHEGQRDRWPFFGYDPEKPGTLGAGPGPEEGTRSDFTVFWHAELMRDASCSGAASGKCLLRELARGRADVRSAPAEQGGVLRWIGPTRALATIGGLDSLVDAPVRLTSIQHWKAPSGDGVAFLSAIRLFTGLRRVDVDPAALELPDGYMEIVLAPVQTVRGH